MEQKNNYISTKPNYENRNHREKRFEFFNALAEKNIEALVIFEDILQKEGLNDSDSLSCFEVVGIVKELNDKYAANIIAQTYISSETAYNTGVLRTTISQLKLKKFENKIMSGFNKSAEHLEYRCIPDDSLQNTLNNIKANATSRLEYGKEYIIRWQMYDKLFHDRVRDK